MRNLDCESTDPGLIHQVADWANAMAWRKFDARYRPAVRRWAAQCGVVGDDVEELAQIVLVEAANRLKSFPYDPKRTFRGWLYTLTRSRAMDLARTRRRSHFAWLEDENLRMAWAVGLTDPDTTPPMVAPELLRLAEEVRQAVQMRVDDKTWQAFWLVKVDGKSVAEAAALLQKSYAAAFRNQERVARMLRMEADRRRGLQSDRESGHA